MLRGRVLNSPKWQRISKDIYFIFFFGLTVFFTATKSLKGNHEARDDGPDRIVSEIKTQFSNHVTIQQDMILFGRFSQSYFNSDPEGI